MATANPPLLCEPQEKRRIELKNIDLAYSYVLGFFGPDIEQASPCTDGMIRYLHKIVIDGIYGCGGNYRDVVHPVIISGASFVPVHASQVEFEVAELIQRIRGWDRDNPNLVTRIHLAAESFHQFNKIHPFRGGNGRVSRLLLHLMLYEMKVLEPPEQLFEYIVHRRQAYLRALASADDGSFDEIHRFMVRGIFDLRLNVLLTLLSRNDMMGRLKRILKDRAIRRFLTDTENRYRISDSQFHLYRREVYNAVVKLTIEQYGS